MSTIILAGGASSRMGRDKASLPVNETTLVQSLISRFAGMGPVVVVLRPGQEMPVENAVVTRDVLQGSGPLVGLHAGLVASPDEANFALACDLPFAEVRLAEHILSKLSESDAVVPKWENGLEPLFAAYRKSCIVEIEAVLRGGDGRMRALLDRVRTLYVEEEDLRRFDPKLRSFTNINTPEDYDSYLRIVSEAGGQADSSLRSE